MPRIREAFGAPLTGLQSVRHRLAEMAVELEAARLMTYHAAQRLGVGHPQAPRSVTMAKYHTARIGGGAGEMQLEILSRELTP
jgi:acyl-CoA dehydrogenase